MKTIQMVGENLYFNLLMAPICYPQDADNSVSFAVGIRFVDGPEITDAKVVLHSRTQLAQDENKSLFSFSGSIIKKDGTKNLCTGYSCKISQFSEESFGTVIDSEPTQFESNITKQEFQKLAKDFCKNQGIPVLDNGNVKSGEFPLFQKVQGINPGYLLSKQNAGLKIHTIMCNNLFPIERNEENGKDVVTFGEFVTDNLIREYSADEAMIRGVRIG